MEYVEYRNEQGQLHREDGPAKESDTYREWWVNGRLHREGAPAVDYSSGTRAWYLHGQLHRLDGPAVEYSNGAKSYYVLGKYLTEKEFYTSIHKPTVPETRQLTL